jgi:hypothetical protein
VLYARNPTPFVAMMAGADDMVGGVWRPWKPRSPVVAYNRVKFGWQSPDETMRALFHQCVLKDVGGHPVAALEASVSHGNSMFHVHSAGPLPGPAIGRLV